MLIQGKWYVSKGVDVGNAPPAPSTVASGAGAKTAIYPGAHNCVLRGPYDTQVQADEAAAIWQKENLSGTQPYVWQPARDYF
jgi:hypothetical protein